MGKIINSTYITLDGVVESPHQWPSSGQRDPRWETIQTELLMSCDAVLMGRRTYDGFAPVWPTRSGDPFADHMNSMPKYVVSSTLTTATWSNTHVLNGNVAEQIADLKSRTGKNIVQYGVGAVTRLLIENRLLDELHLWVHPIMVGGADQVDFLATEAAASLLRLRNTTTLGNGVVILRYEF